MILRRLAHAISEQTWLTVVLELYGTNAAEQRRLVQEMGIR